MSKQLTGLKQIYSSDILTVGSAQLEKLGTHGWDENGFEYVYLSGTASVVADDWCVFDENFATTRLVADEVGPVGVAATAITLNQFGWFLIKGVVLGNSDTISADSSLYIDGTAGRVDDLGVSGDLVIGAYSMTAAVNNKATCYITYPHVSNDLGGGGGGSPTGAQYVVLTTHADLTAERVLTGTPNQIILTDGGANGNITLATPQNISATATVEFGSATIHTLASGTASITGGTITGITDLAVADGGTGTSTAGGARINLGLVIGTDVQAYDAQLTDIAGLTPSGSTFIIGDGSNFISHGAAAVRGDLGLVIGTNVQAWDTQLDDIAALALSGTTFIVGNGTNYVSHGTAAVKSELDAADKHIRIISQNSSTAYTLVLTDDHSLIEVGTALTYRIVIPANASVAFPIGTRMGIRQTVVGTVLIGTAAAVTVNSQGTAYVTNGQYAIAQIFKVDTNTWALEGNLTT